MKLNFRNLWANPLRSRGIVFGGALVLYLIYKAIQNEIYESEGVKFSGCNGWLSGAEENDRVVVTDGITAKSISRGVWRHESAIYEDATVKILCACGGWSEPSTGLTYHTFACPNLNSFSPFGCPPIQEIR